MGAVPHEPRHSAVDSVEAAVGLWSPPALMPSFAFDARERSSAPRIEQTDVAAQLQVPASDRLAAGTACEKESTSSSLDARARRG
jgi:hypothetical protein